MAFLLFLFSKMLYNIFFCLADMNICQNFANETIIMILWNKNTILFVNYLVGKQSTQQGNPLRTAFASLEGLSIDLGLSLSDYDTLS